MRSTIGVDNGGFDRLEVATAARLGPVTQVRIGDEPVDYTVEATEPHRVVVSIPRLTAQDSGALVELVFQAEVLRYGSTFSVRVWDSTQPLEVPQSVQEGDATPIYEDNRVWVATKAEHQGLLQMSRKPAVLTPNGDERNDEVGLEYRLIELTGRSWVAVAVWDLSGRQVRQVYEGLDGVGAYERGVGWSGRVGAAGAARAIPIPSFCRCRPSNVQASRTPARGILNNFSFVVGRPRKVNFRNLSQYSYLYDRTCG